MSDSSHCAIEPMAPADWPDISSIYAEGIDTGNATFQTEAPAWEEWDAGHLPFARLVARRDGAIVGWAALSSVSTRPCYRGVAEISIYIGAGARGLGVGDALMRATLDAARAGGLWTVCAQIFPENFASLALHQKHGFHLVGVRKQYGQTWDGRFRDVCLLDWRVGDEEIS